MKTDNPPTQEKTRPHSPELLNLDPAWLFTAEQRVRFSAVEMVGVCMTPLELPNGLFLFGPKPPRPWSIRSRAVSKGIYASTLCVGGLSLEDAMARCARLNLPQRPDGFHLWN